MADPQRSYPRSGTTALERPDRAAVSGADLRAVLADWAVPLALAVVVGLVLLATPRPLLALDGFPSSAVLNAGGVSRITLGLVDLAAVLAVALSRYRLGLSCVLTAVPWVLSPLVANMVWGWWLAGLAVLGIAVFDGARKRALAVAALVTALAVAYCTSGMHWNVPLVGPVNLYNRDPDRWFDGTRQFYLAVYLGAVCVVVLAAALGRAAAQRVRARRVPCVPDQPMPALATGVTTAGAVTAERIPPGPLADRIGTLTRREREVLLAVAKGMSNAEIAAELVIGTETVKTHVSEVLRKLGCRDRARAIITAYESGLVGPRT